MVLSSNWIAACKASRSQARSRVAGGTLIKRIIARMCEPSFLLDRFIENLNCSLWPGIRFYARHSDFHGLDIVTMLPSNFVIGMENGSLYVQIGRASCR